MEEAVLPLGTGGAAQGVLCPVGDMVPAGHWSLSSECPPSWGRAWKCSKDWGWRRRSGGS